MVRHKQCCCLWKEDCRGFSNNFKSISNQYPYMYGFFKLPKFDKNPEGKKAMSMKDFISALGKHGFSVQNHNKKDIYIAYHHWHPRILRMHFDNSTMFPKVNVPITISKADSMAIDMPDADRRSEGDVVNYPNQSRGCITTTYNALYAAIEASKVAVASIKASKLATKQLDTAISPTETVVIPSTADGKRTISRRMVLEKIEEQEDKETKARDLLKEKIREGNIRRAEEATRQQLRDKLKRDLQASSSLVRDRVKHISKKLKAVKKSRKSLKEKLVSIKNKYSLCMNGINRLSIIDDKWHSAFPDMCRYLFGIGPWKVLKTHLSIMFKIKTTVTLNEIMAKPSKYHDLEKALMWLLHHKRGLEFGFIAQLFCIKNKQKVSNYLKTWSTKFETVGEYLSILDIPEEYFFLSQPQDFKRDEKLKHVGILLDGKDFPCETIRTNATYTKCQYSDKIKSSAIRYIATTLPSGLTPFSSYPCWGRATETAHMNLLSQVPSQPRLL